MKLPLLHSVELPPAPLWIVQASADGALLAASAHAAICFDPELVERGQVEIAKGRLGGASLHPSGDRFAVLDEGRVRVHRCDGEALGAWAPSEGSLESNAHLCWARDGARLWVGPSSEGEFWVLAAETLEPIAWQRFTWPMGGDLILDPHPEGQLVHATVAMGQEGTDHSMLRVAGGGITRHPVPDTSGRILLGWDRSGREGLWWDADGSRIERRDVATGTLVGALPERLAGWSAAWVGTDRAVLCSLSGALLVLDLAELEVEHVLRADRRKLVTALPEPDAEGVFRAVAAVPSARLVTVDRTHRCCLWDAAELFGEERPVDDARSVTRTLVELYPAVEGEPGEADEPEREREEEGRRFIAFLQQNGAIEVDESAAPKFFDGLGELLRKTTKAEAVSEWLMEQAEVVDLHATDEQIQVILDRW